MTKLAYLSVLTALAFALHGAKAEADAPKRTAPDVYLVIGRDGERDPPLVALAQAWARGQGRALRDLSEELEIIATATVSRAQLTLLGETEQALLEARELSASLREAAALRVLEAAESKLLTALDLPGAHAYLAEVYVQLGLCAAQLGSEGLAETALTRAFSLDRARRVEAAETPPATLLFAQRIARGQESRPSSETPLSVTPAGARVWLDGVEQGVGSIVLHAPAGVHLLVARATGHAPYATLLSLAPGRRPIMPVVLSPLSDEQAKRALLSARASVKQARTPAIALSRSLGADVHLIEAVPGPLLRAVVHRCTAAGCNLLESVDPAGLAQTPGYAARDPQAILRSRGRGRASTRSTAPRPAARPDSIPLWRRWPLWAAAAAVVVSGVTAGLVVTRDQATHHQRQLEIDPGTVPP